MAWLPFALVACGGGGDTPPPVTQPPAVTAVSLSAAALTLTGVGTEGTLDATLAPASASASISWQSDNPAVATVTAVGARATVRAVAGGTARVVARAGAVEASAAITVVPIARAITLAADTLRLTVGATQTLAPAITADAGADVTVDWATGAPAVASVSAAGTVAALAPGTALLTATLRAFPALSATRVVVVTPPAVTMAITPVTATLVAGGSRQLTAAVTAPAGVSTAVTWRAATPTIASVSGNGLVNALAPGATEIVATSVANPAVSASATITVTAPTVRGITLTPAVASVYVGGTRPITVTVDADAGANTMLTWTSSASAVAVVSAAGVVTGLAPGSAVITARSVAVPTVMATAQVTVLDAPGATEFSARRIGSGPSLGGWSVLALQNFSATQALVGTGVQGGGGGSFANAVLLRTASGLSDITPACCARAGLPSALAGVSAAQSVVGFTGDNVFAGINPKLFAVNGGAPAELPWPPAGATGGEAAPRQLFTPDGTTWITRLPSGTVYRLDGSSWTSLGVVSNGLGDQLAAGLFLGTTDHIGLFCDPTPTLLRWQGGGTRTPLPVMPGACATSFDTEIAGVRSDSLVAVNAAGMHLFNGSTWRTVTNGLSAGDTLRVVTMCGTERYASSSTGAVYRLVGNSLTRLGTSEQTSALGDFGSVRTRLSCAPDGSLRAGGGAALLTRWTGSSWEEENYAPTLWAIAMAPNGDAAAVGDGVVYRRSGGSWTRWRRFNTYGLQLRHAVLRADDELLATGSVRFTTGPLVVMRHSGGAWSEILIPSHTRASAMVAWGSTGALLIANTASSSVEVLRLEGTGTTVQAFGSGIPAALASHNGQVALVVTRAGGVFRYDGTAWSAAGTLGVTAFDFRATMLSATDAMAATCTGEPANPSRVFRSSGLSTWSEIPFTGLPTVTCVRALFGTAPTDAYALVDLASGDRRLVRWNGNTWQLVTTPALTQVWAGAARPGNTLLAGSLATIIEGVPPAAPRARQR